MNKSAIDRATEIIAELAEHGQGPAAVRHPLGFHCFPVLRETGYGLCVHVWHGGPAATEPPPHSHSWDLTSYVLDGAVVNRLIDVHDAPTGATDRVYDVDTSEAVDRLRATPRLVRRTLRAEHTTTGGGVYRLAPGRFHTTAVPADGGAITVVVGSGSVGTARDRVLGPLDGRSYDTVRRRCDPTETTALARAVLDRISP